MDYKEVTQDIAEQLTQMILDGVDRGFKKGLLQGRKQAIDWVRRNSRTWEANTFNREMDGLPSYPIITLEMELKTFNNTIKSLWGLDGSR